MKMFALLKDLLPYLTVLFLILTNIFLSNVLYEQLLFLELPSFLASSLTVLFCYFFCILVVFLGLLLDTFLNPWGGRPSPDSSSSPPSSSSTAFSSASSSPPSIGSPFCSSGSSPVMDSPPPYCLVMDGEKGDLPSYEEATQ